MDNSSSSQRCCFLALDQGGSTSRALVFDSSGIVIASAKQAVQTIRNGPDRVEQDPLELVRSLRQVAESAVDQLPANQRESLHSCGLVTQRSSIVCWNKMTGEPLSPVISWQDTRAASLLARIEPQQQAIYQTTGLYPNAHFGASKLRWCLDHLSQVREAEQSQQLIIGPLASYLLYSLLEGSPCFVDPVNASRTLLMSLAEGNWDQALLDYWGISRDLLPDIARSNSAFGRLSLQQLSVPMRLVNGDQSAAAFAYGRPKPEHCYINMGSGAFVYQLTDGVVIKDRLLGSVIYWGQQPHFVREGTINGAASALSWFAKQEGIDQFADCLAEFFSANSDLSALPLFLNGVGGLASPDWRADFASEFIFVGAMNVSVPQRLAAIAESIIFLLQRNLSLFELAAETKIVVSGGLSNSDTLCQWLSDLTQLPVLRPAECEASARGLAFLLADQPKSWASLPTKIFSPQNNIRLLDRYSQWQQLMANKLAQHE